MTSKHRQQAVDLFRQLERYLDAEITSLDELACLLGDVDDNGDPRAFLFLALKPNEYAATGGNPAATPDHERHVYGTMPPDLGWSRGRGDPLDIAERPWIATMRRALDEQEPLAVKAMEAGNFDEAERIGRRVSRWKRYLAEIAA